jgi:hypothetical protein
MKHSELRSIVTREMDDALAARARGQEGRARVCFRRAAGWAIASLQANVDQESHLGNALEALTWFGAELRFQQELRESAIRLTTRVSDDHTLPFEQDPQSDAERLIDFVYGESWRTIHAEDGHL